jgi:hypothetical protein
MLELTLLYQSRQVKRAALPKVRLAGMAQGAWISVPA